MHLKVPDSYSFTPEKPVMHDILIHFNEIKNRCVMHVESNNKRVLQNVNNEFH